MGTVITREDLKAYAEVDYIIKHMNEKYYSKIPQSLQHFFENIKDPDYKVYVNPHQPLQDQGLTKYALEIIALLHIKYWCENGARKEELLEKMKENQEKFEAQLREQFSTQTLFSKENSSETDSEPDKMVTAYSKYMEDNPDIQDFTDLREQTQNAEGLTENTPQKKPSIFKKISLFFTKIFRKSTD